MSLRLVSESEHEYRARIRKLRLIKYRKKINVATTFNERRLVKGDKGGWCFSTDVRNLDLKHDRRLEARRLVGGRHATDPSLQPFVLKGLARLIGLVT